MKTWEKRIERISGKINLQTHMVIHISWLSWKTENGIQQIVTDITTTLPYLVLRTTYFNCYPLIIIQLFCIRSYIVNASRFASWDVPWWHGSHCSCKCAPHYMLRTGVAGAEKLKPMNSPPSSQPVTWGQTSSMGAQIPWKHSPHHDCIWAKSEATFHTMLQLAFSPPHHQTPAMPVSASQQQPPSWTLHKDPKLLSFQIHDIENYLLHFEDCLGLGVGQSDWVGIQTLLTIKSQIVKATWILLCAPQRDI